MTQTTHHFDAVPGICGPLTVPLLAGDWRPLAAAHRSALLDRIHETLSERAAPDPRLFDAVVDARVLRLPFYAEAALVHVEVVPEAGAPAAWTVFCAQDRVQVVNGESLWLHAWNAASPRGDGSPLFPLDAPLAAAYLKFFCGVVWGEQGPFRIVEEPDDALLTGKLQCGNAAGRLHPIKVVPAAGGDGAYDVQATLLYGGTLFAAEFRVYRTGMVQMLDDEPLAVNVGVRWDMASPLHQCIMHREVA